MKKKKTLQPGLEPRLLGRKTCAYRKNDIQSTDNLRIELLERRLFRSLKSKQIFFQTIDLKFYFCWYILHTFSLCENIIRVFIQRVMIICRITKSDLSKLWISRWYLKIFIKNIIFFKYCLKQRLQLLIFFCLIFYLSILCQFLSH